MVINFVGLFSQPSITGELSDETHIARELERLGHTVNRVQRDIWKAYCDGDRNPDWNLPIKADINLVAKWPHFNDRRYVDDLREASRTGMSSGSIPLVFYWVWDYMPNPDIPDWHLEMAREADLYLSGELGIFSEYKKHGVKPYYFQMDVCDGDIPTFDNEPKKYDVIFTGSCIDQGHRKEWLQIINKEIPVKIWGWGYEEWQKLGFEAYPPVYGEDYNRLIAQSKIILGFSVEPNCWGYWSNRVGKVLRAGGFLLQEYAPGMEQRLPSTVRYFSSPEEAVNRIKYELGNEKHRINREPNASKSWNWTSRNLSGKLIRLMERYLKNGDKWLL